jgi:hypothetical protein
MFEKGILGRLRPAPGGRDGRGQGLVLALILSLASLAAIGLLLVWLNLERTKLAYKARNLQHEAEQARDLNSKLSVEREHLLSPAQLGKKAELMGLGPAKPGQIRRMEPQAGAIRQGGEPAE